MLEDPTLVATGKSGSIPQSEEGSLLQRGTSVDRFVIIDELGRGAMGTVYAAFDTKLERQVALKLLHSADRGIGGLLAEAQALARINHPNVVTVHDVGEHDGRLFLAMELIRGTTLRHHQRTKGQTWQSTLARYRLAARGLAAVHAANLVHGDFKPENVMVADDGRVLVMDFGIARSLETAPSLDTEELSSSGSRSIQVSRILGTPAYMAPEQFSLDTVSPLSDQFAFCVALHEALWCERPFEGTSLPELALAVSEGTRRPRPRKSPVPRWLEPIVDRGLSQAPQQRFETMTALDDAFDASLRRRMKGFVLVGAMGLTATVATSAVLASATASTPCGEAGEAFAQDVVAPQMRRLEERVLDMSHPDAEAAWSHTQRSMDRFTAEWGAAEATQCRPQQGLSRGVVSARSACLEQQRETVSSALELLAADADLTLARASLLSAILPETSQCLALDEADSEVELHTEELAQAHRTFGRAQSYYALGRKVDAEALVTDALAQIRSLGANRLATQLLLWRSAKRRYLGNEPGALADALEAQTSAARSGSRALMFDAWLTRINYSTVVEPDARDRIEVLMEGAELALLAAGDPPHLRANFLAAKGSWLDELGRTDEAVELVTRAVALADETRLPASERASMYNLRGAILAKAGDFEAAVSELKRSIQLRESIAGPHAPGLQTARGNLGSICMVQNDFSCARREFELMQKNLAAAGDETSTNAAQLESTLAELAYWEGRAEDSERHARRSLAICRAGGFADRSFGINARRSLLRSLLDRGEWEEGTPLARELVQVSETRYGETEAATPALAAAARFYSASGAHDEAMQLARRATQLRSAHLEATDPRVAKAWADEALALMGGSRLSEAKVAVTRAQSLLRAAPTATSVDRAEVNFIEAQLRYATGERRAAMDDARAARDAIDHDAPESLAARDAIDAWLAGCGNEKAPPPRTTPP